MNTNRVLTVKGLAEMTGWSESHIYKLTSNGVLKHSKPTGKCIFFDREYVENFLLGNSTMSRAEVEGSAIRHIVAR